MMRFETNDDGSLAGRCENAVRPIGHGIPRILDSRPQRRNRNRPRRRNSAVLPLERSRSHSSRILLIFFVDQLGSEMDAQMQHRR